MQECQKIVEIDPVGHFEKVRWEVEINTLEELLDLLKEAGYELIISDGYIEIYDDYRE